jgi:hypothetical protein
MKKLITIVALTVSVLGTQAFAGYDPGPTTGSASNQTEHNLGHYPVQSQTIVQHPTAAQTKQAEEGDFYAPVTTSVRKPTAQELKEAQKGDFYAPMNSN